MKDREILRILAAEIGEIAHLPVQKENEKLYRALNGLNPIRPVVLLDELPWNQLNGEGELNLYCEDKFLRDVEWGFRATLYRWKHCRGDMIVAPFYPLYRTLRVGSKGIDRRETTMAFDKTNHIVSHKFEDQLATYEDLEKLHVPEISVDDDETNLRYNILNEIFGDILPIKIITPNIISHFAPWDELAYLRGVGPIYDDLYDRPEFLHATMQKLVSIQLEVIAKIEKMGCVGSYCPNIHCTAGFSDELATDKLEGSFTRSDIWGRGTAQMFSEVSPKMHDEFEIEYMHRFFKGFGLVYYGCCEPLHRKIQIVKKLPNLRKISITPWADVRMSAEQMGKDYVMARKPNPAQVAVNTLDEEAVRKDILETLTCCKQNGTPCEFTLKDISSVNYHPENLEKWERIVMETVKNF